MFLFVLLGLLFYHPKSSTCCDESWHIFVVSVCLSVEYHLFWTDTMWSVQCTSCGSGHLESNRISSDKRVMSCDEKLQTKQKKKKKNKIGQTVVNLQICRANRQNKCEPSLKWYVRYITLMRHILCCISIKKIVLRLKKPAQHEQAHCCSTTKQAKQNACLHT